MNRAEKILLCSTRFWVGAGGWGAKSLTTPTLRKGVRHVARKQGVDLRALDAAERKLMRDGLIVRPGRGTIALTATGVKQSRGACHRVALPPWDWRASYKGRLDGARKRRR